MKRKQKSLILILLIVLLLVPSMSVNADGKKKEKSTAKVFALKNSRTDSDPTNFVRVVITPDKKVTVTANYEGSSSVGDGVAKAFKGENHPTTLYIGQKVNINTGGNPTCPPGSSGCNSQTNTSISYIILTRDECKKYANKKRDTPNITYACTMDDSTKFVYSKAATKRFATKNGYKAGNVVEYDSVNDCEGMLTVELLKLLRKYYSLIIWGTFIGLVMLGILDVSKAVTAADEGEMKKSYIRFSKRAIVAVIIVLLPTILGLFLTVIASGNDYGKKCVNEFIYKK